MSKFFNLNLNDWWKAFLMAVASAVVATIGQMVNTGHFPSTLADLKVIGSAVLVAVIAYISKNLTTNSQGKIGPEVK